MKRCYDGTQGNFKSEPNGVTSHRQLVEDFGEENVDTTTFEHVTLCREDERGHGVVTRIVVDVKKAAERHGFEPSITGLLDFVNSLEF